MVRVKTASKPPAHWKAHNPTARERQETKGRQSKATKDTEPGESWLLLPEFDQNGEKPETMEPNRSK